MSQKAWMDRLFQPVSIAPLVFFRIVFAVAMLYEVCKYTLRGSIYHFYIDPIVHFQYYGFEWVNPWPGNGMYIHFAIMGLAAFLVLIGYRYRIAAGLLCVSFTYVFLLEQTLYLNHHYMMCLLAFIMAIIPAQKSFSLDVYTEREEEELLVPAWTVWLLRFQIAVVYFFGGVAKMNYDWVVRQEPIRAWLASGKMVPFVGPEAASPEWLVFLFIWGGLLFDLCIVPFLLWKRTRMVAFLCAVSFHVANMFIFHIDIFPWVMIAGTLLFFPAEAFQRRLPFLAKASQSITPFKKSSIVVAVLMIYFVIQVCVPLRHHFYPDETSWTEQGDRFAWRMMLKQKNAKIEFRIVGDDLKPIPHRDPYNYLTQWQLNNMATQPDLILQFVHYLGNVIRQQGHPDVKIYVQSRARLNARPTQRLIDPDINLLEKQRSFLHKDWIVPLKP